jgi:hypothetical protein
MVDVEFRVIGDRREGLLLALGQVVIASGFRLLRQRMVAAQEGVELVMLVRGPDARLLQLEENLGTHPLVRSFETATSEGAPSQFAATPANPSHVAAAPPPPAPADNRRIEALLPQLARDYPNIFMHVRALESELVPE